ncbi:uncharacterized protein RSE6_09978 [Rhynchosporium secalis]|uniref:Uncharacterized protein n=1 Tax=Rhynchosporium secalis TaxID=38038 RepID=A0A1E1MJC7_RHYSE|nr:uncharacterized protein RSE6_09978 [Rhynchosporium secalis]
MSGRHHRKSGTPKCADCVTLNTHRARPLPTLHCANHACPATEPSGNVCGKKKSKDDYGCMFHRLPPRPPRVCEVEDCILLPAKLSLFCKLHKCVYSGCLEFANATGNQDFCDNHKCCVQQCQSLRKRNRVDNDLKLAVFCFLHECETNGCEEPKVSCGHCRTHYCTFPKCPAARRTDFENSTLCPKHFREKLETGAAAAARQEFEKQFQKQLEHAEVEAIREELEKERAQIKREREDEVEQKLFRIYELKLAEDEERRAREEERERIERKHHNKERSDTKYENSRQQEKFSNPERQFFEKRTPNVSQARYSHKDGQGRNPAFTEMGEGYYTSFENRSGPRGRIRRDTNGYREKAEANQSRHSRQDRSKRDSDGSFEHVELYQDEDHDWKNDSATHSYESDRDRRNEHASPRFGTAYRGERGYSNEANAGSSGDQSTRGENFRHGSQREGRYQSEGNPRVIRKDRDVRYDDERKRQNHRRGRDEDMRSGSDAHQYHEDTENAKRSGKGRSGW